MAFRLEVDESVAEAAPRLGTERVEQAIEGLRDADRSTRDTAIHEARKRLKETRAVLRLVRAGLDKKTYQEDNAALRDTGRLLSGARDAWVRVQTLDKLTDAQSPTSLRQRLLAEYEAATGGDLPEGAFEALEDARCRTGAWAPAGGDDLLASGLERTYRRGRDALRTARAEPTAEHLHEWRKRVKDLWYQMRLVEPAWPDVLGAQVEQTHHLADLLGDDHDLAVLSEHVQPTGALADLLTRRRQELQAEALPLGERIYAEKPKGFVRRVVTAHRVWRSTRSTG